MIEFVIWQSDLETNRILAQWRFITINQQRHLIVNARVGDGHLHLASLYLGCRYIRNCGLQQRVFAIEGLYLKLHRHAVIPHIAMAVVARLITPRQFSHIVLLAAPVGLQVGGLQQGKACQRGLHGDHRGVLFGIHAPKLLGRGACHPVGYLRRTRGGIDILGHERTD